MKNYIIKMNGHHVTNGDFETLAGAIDRVYTLRKIFRHSEILITINL